jgi:hypothetical protein
MSTTSINIRSLPPEELRRLNEWNRTFQFESQRELVEYIIFLGHLAHEMGMVKARLDDVSSRNALYSIGRAFLDGEFRLDDGPEFHADQDLEESIEMWKEYLDISSKAAVERHLMATGLMVWGLATGPINGERFAGVIGFLARSLMRARIDGNIEETVKEYRAWQSKQRRKKVIQPRRVINRR